MKKKNNEETKNTDIKGNLNMVKENIKKIINKSNKTIKEGFNSTFKENKKDNENEKRYDNIEEKANKTVNFLEEKFDQIINYIKKMDKEKIIILSVIIIGILILIPNLFKTKIKYIYDYNYVDETVIKYKVKINIDFENNLIFSRYDVIFNSSDLTETLTHGKDKSLELSLKEGEETLTFVNSNDESIKKSVTINVDSNMEVGFKISCKSNKIIVTKTYTNKDEELLNDELTINKENSSYVNKNYNDVIKELNSLGFTNIKENPIYDIEYGFTKEGQIKNVTIDGKDNYKIGDVFNKDVEIIINYHMNVESDPSKSKPPYDSSSAKNINYEKVLDAFKSSGFTNIIVEEVPNNDNKPKNSVAGIYVNSSNIEKNKSYKLDTKIDILYYGEPSGEITSNKLSLANAKKAFEKYGKQKYPYGFKCHWFLDLKRSEQSSDGQTWYFEVGVTIENEYGNKYNSIAEGTVTGNDRIQKVTKFNIHN